jgi:hypothetical protein
MAVAALFGSLALKVLAFGAALLVGAPAVLAQDGGGASAVPLAGRAEGAPVERVDVVLVRGSDNPARDGAALARLRGGLQDLQGRPLSRAALEARLAAARAKLGFGRIDWRLLDGDVPGRLVLRVELDTASPGDPRAGAPGFPVLHQDGRGLLTAILAGGFGFYADPNPWFGQPPLFTRGSPIARRLPGARPAWTEGFVEAGLGGAAQIGDSPFYAYGALTVLSAWSAGQDIYRDDGRFDTAVEKAYGGLLYVDPDTGSSLNMSAGRQNVTLNDGFLVHFVRGSSNSGRATRTTSPS